MSNIKTKTLTLEHRRKLSLSKLADKNSQWKDDKVGYNALHNWVRQRLPKPDKCQKCFEGPVYLDLANITVHYTRNLSNWKYFCRRCHMWFDGRFLARQKRQMGITQTHKSLLTFIHSLTLTLEVAAGSEDLAEHFSRSKSQAPQNLELYGWKAQGKDWEK